jgi:2,3-bisphosphoglycerate-independent phosphoglycerate mutase
MKYVLVIGDGMADVALDALNGLTPLQKAEIPVMDNLAAEGMLGRVKNVPDGQPPGSDTAILSIFGCDPVRYYFGRAPLEAAAQGVTLKEGDLAFRCNMATIDEGDLPFGKKTIVSHSAGSIDGKSSRELVEDLFRAPEFRSAAEKAGVCVYPTDSYRHIAVQSNGDGRKLEMSPPHDHLGEKVCAHLPRGNENAQVLASLMELSNKVLDQHPINRTRRQEGRLPCNCVWFWAHGTAAKLPNFEEKYGKKGAVISAVPLCHGIAALMGLDRIYVEGATGELDTNYEGKAFAAVRALDEGFDFVAVHVEAPDECTHNFDIPGKIEAIENLDSRVIRPILTALRETQTDFRMLVLSDHKTLSTTGAHDGEPVPFILYDSRETKGSGLGYSEESAMRGVFISDGTALMDMLFRKE